MIRYSDITLAVLAGGKGSRMGMAKGEIRIDGRPILECLLEKLRWAGPTLLVTAPGREMPLGHQLFGCEVTDPVAGMGPLRGVLTALEHLTTPLLVVLTVDMPCIGREQLEWLIARIEASQLIGAMCSRCREGSWQVEPFPFVLRSSALETVRGSLLEGGRAASYPLCFSGFAVLPAPAHWNAEVWTNLNTPGDLETFEHGRV